MNALYAENDKQRALLHNWADGVKAQREADAANDRTSDAYLTPLTAHEVRTTTRETRQAYDSSDLAEECDETIVQLLKDGDALEAGLLLMQRMEATIKRRIDWSLS